MEKIDKKLETNALKLCVVCHQPFLAGAERSLLDLVRLLVREHEVDCTVVVPGDGPLIPLLESANVRVIRGEYHWWCSVEEIEDSEARRRITESLGRFKTEILPAVAEIGPDVVCTQTIVTPYGAWLAAQLGKPHIWNLREYGEAEGFLFFLPFENVLSFIRRSSDFIFGANSMMCTELMPDLRAEEHDVLYPSIEIPPETHADRSLLPCRDESFVLGEFATIGPQKELGTAIRALALLADKGLDVELLLVGEQEPGYVGELRELIEKLGVGDRVHLMGFMENVFPAMASVDAVVISASVHTLGRTSIEGMLLGKPVVYPLGTGFDDYQQDGVTGLGYAASDPQAMADRIEQLITSENLATEIAERARVVARRLFTRQGFSGKFYAKAFELKHLEAPKPSRERQYIDHVLTSVLGERG